MKLDRDTTGKMTVAVDLDGVLAELAPPYGETGGWKGIDVIGDPIEGAADFLKALAEDYRVMIFTTRACERPFGPGGIKQGDLHNLVATINGWLVTHDMPYDEIWTGPGKPIYSALVDDRAVACRPQIGTPHVQFKFALGQVRQLAPLVPAYEDMTVKQLRALAEKEGVDVPAKARKAVLVARLSADLAT